MIALDMLHLNRAEPDLVADSILLRISRISLVISLVTFSAAETEIDASGPEQISAIAWMFLLKRQPLGRKKRSPFHVWRRAEPVRGVGQKPAQDRERVARAVAAGRCVSSKVFSP